MACSQSWLRPFARPGEFRGDKGCGSTSSCHLVPEPPLRLLLGRDCYALAEKSALEKLGSERMWKDLSTSTDLVAAEGQGGNM
jgi:hypothetical protein